jgi:hypothetical protein
MQAPRTLVALFAAAALVAGCGGGAMPSSSASASNAGTSRQGCLDAWPAPDKVSTSGPIPSLVNSDLAPGPTRLLIGLLDANGYAIGAPEWKLSTQLFDLTTDGCTPLAAASPLTFEWAINKVSGFFVAPATLPPPVRELGILIGGTDATGTAVSIRFAIPVAATGIAPRPGDDAPRIATPIAAESPHGLAGVSTDSTPLARLYAHSAADLLRKNEPFAIVFASPAFCTSRACGPTLTVVKQVAGDFPSLVIIHVEPYITEWNGSRLAPVMSASGRLQPNPIAVAWQLPIEPWIFTVGPDGKIVDSFEGVVSATELRAALAAIAKR